MASKRIAFLKSEILKRGGLEKYTLRLAERFVQEGHEVFLLTTGCNAGDLKDTSFHVVNLGTRLPISSLHLLAFDLKCRRYLEKHPMDVIFGMDRNFCKQTHYRAGNGVHAAYLDRRKQGASWWKCGSLAINPLHRLILQMEKRTFESPDLKVLFTNSHMVRQEILHYYPRVDPEKISVVHNGVEWNEIQTAFKEGLKRRAEITKALGLSTQRFQFLFIGNEYERKGLKRLIDALTGLKDPNFELSVVGKERHPEVFIKYAKTAGLQEKVHFFGEVKDTKPFYTAADCLVIPSLYDPFANVTVEALAFGVYVISSRENGGSEVLTSTDLGLVFGDSEELVHSLGAAQKMPKSEEQALHIRSAVMHLDFSNQIEKIISSL